MSNIKIEFNFKEILYKLNQKPDKFNRRVDKLSNDLRDINLRLNKVETRLDFKFPASQEKLEKIEGSQKAQIWTLIGGLITAVFGLLAAVGRLILLYNS